MTVQSLSHICNITIVLFNRMIFSCNYLLISLLYRSLNTHLKNKQKTDFDSPDRWIIEENR